MIGGNFLDIEDYENGYFSDNKFVYTTGRSFTSADVGNDQVGYFSSQNDVIVLSRATFRALSTPVGQPLSTSDFATVTSDDAAATTRAAIVYNTTNGKIFYNENGNSAGLGTGSQFVTLREFGTYPAPS